MWSIIRSIIGLLLLFTQTVVVISSDTNNKKPNLIVIMTDEHNLRTLGCYRDLMKKKHAQIWGKGVEVSTPNIDTLARDGVLFTNFNAVVPECTPARGSFVTGLYPTFSGATTNDSPLNSNAVTFAELLVKKANYSTSFIGKWHLNGTEKPGFGNGSGTFGFEDDRFLFNRGHWKFLEETASNSSINVYTWGQRHEIIGTMKQSYTTDFLFAKAKEFINEQINIDKHYALMLSIPDPHGPNKVRPPYNKMFKSFDFNLPKTAVGAYNKQPANPGWAPMPTDLENAADTIKSIEMDKSWQEGMRNIFGMVKLIDDKVGELLNDLKTLNQENNTIVVFTSDHGDLMAEHGLYDKYFPYKTSAGVPFVIRYPGKIPEGKIIKTAFTSPDFAPTILSIMGIDHSDVFFQGIDGSEDILNKNKFNSKNQIRFIYGRNFVAAVNLHYKLILSSTDAPYLFNLRKNPRETINFYYSDEQRSKSMGWSLVAAMKEFQFHTKSYIFLDPPACQDSKDQIPHFPYRVCDDLVKNEYRGKCKLKKIHKFCPNTCGSCCEDSKGFLIRHLKVKKCKWMRKRDLKNKSVRKFCPLKYNACEG